MRWPLGWWTRTTQQDAAKERRVDSSQGGGYEGHMGAARVSCLLDGVDVELLDHREIGPRVECFEDDRQPSDVRKRQACEPVGIGPGGQASRPELRRRTNCVASQHYTFGRAGAATGGDDDGISVVDWLSALQGDVAVIGAHGRSAE